MPRPSTAHCTAISPLLVGVQVDKQHIDILTVRFVLQPQRFDVVADSKRLRRCWWPGR